MLTPNILGARLGVDNHHFGPSWTKTDHFTIRARGPVDATKDQMRLMMQSPLADCFGLKMHFEAHVS